MRACADAQSAFAGTSAQTFEHIHLAEERTTKSSSLFSATTAIHRPPAKFVSESGVSVCVYVWRGCANGLPYLGKCLDRSLATIDALLHEGRERVVGRGDTRASVLNDVEHAIHRGPPFAGLCREVAVVVAVVAVVPGVRSQLVQRVLQPVHPQPVPGLLGVACVMTGAVIIVQELFDFDKAVARPIGVVVKAGGRAGGFQTLKVVTSLFQVFSVRLDELEFRKRLQSFAAYSAVGCLVAC